MPELTLSLPAADLPIYLRLARALVADVRRGRLRPGERLPGSRALATQLGVHRNTVLAALEELRAEGWIEARAGSGTFVCAELPEPEAPRGKSRSAVGAFHLRPPPSLPGGDLPDPTEAPPPGALVLAGGLPDLRLLPVQELARELRRAMGRHGPAVLGYGDPAGLPRLRGALADLLRARRGIAAGPSSVLVTRGSQQGLYLAAQILVRPGDRVAVEALGYRPAWHALALAGAELVPLAVDAEGLSVVALEAALAQGPLRAVYLTPQHQFPTMAVLPAARRLRLLELARQHRFVVIEDDYDHEFHYEGAPVLPLAASDPAGSVVYVGTLSKVLAPGLRLGFVVAGEALIAAMAVRRRVIDRQGDQATEEAIARLIEDDTIPRHIRRMRRIYAQRRQVVVEAVRRDLAGVVDPRPPPGGLALWPAVDPAVDVVAWAGRAREAGVVFEPGRSFHLHDAPQAAFRLGFGCLEPEELREAVRRLARAL